MNVREIFDSMAYGPAPESNAEVLAWLGRHKARFGHWIDGAFAARCAMSHSADDQPWLDALLGATAPWTVLLFASADNPLLRYCGTRYFFCDGQLESVTAAVDSSRLSHQSTEEAR